MTYTADVADDKAARKAARKALKRERKQQLALETDADGCTKAHKKQKGTAQEPCVPDIARLDGAASKAASRAAYLAKHSITVEGTGAEDFYPFYTFAEANFPRQAQDAIALYDQPTPIQAVSWPIVMGGRDIVGIAETGSGKTMGFALPALPHILRATHKKPIVLVMAPTRELALQTSDEFKKLNVTQVCLYGGMAKGPQYGALRQQPAAVMATPGRLLDLAQEGAVDLSLVTYVVLDEADRMLDIGFEQETRKIMKLVSEQRQTLMFSATWPDAVQSLARAFARDPVRVTVGSAELTANVRVRQTVELVEQYKKDARLLQLLREYNVGSKSRVLVFVLYKRDAPYIEEMLTSKGYLAGALHGNSSQAQREKIIWQFKTGALPIMVATDVASRGLDVDDIEHVINYSMPLTIADYIHRIGRTARAGKNGVAHSFFDANADKRLGWLTAKVLRDAGQAVPPELERFPPPPMRQEEKTCDLKEVKAAPKILFEDSD